MKLNLIANLKFTNDKGKTFEIITKETVMSIGNSVLLKHTPDISAELDKIFKQSEGVTLDLEYKQIDLNGQSVGIITKRIHVNGYEVREYYNADGSRKLYDIYIR